MPSHPASTAPSPGTPRWTLWLAGLAIAVAGLAAYSNSFRGPFVFDDVGSIPNNESLRHLLPVSIPLHPPAGSRTVSGRPVLNLSLAANYALSGLDVRSYHALNLAIHLGAALVLFGLVRRLLRRLGRPGPDLLAFSVALLWTVHPLQTEAVTYLVQRAESLAGLCCLLTLYGFVRSAEGRTCWAALSVLACLTGMAVKETMVTAPVLVLLCDRTFFAGSFREAWRSRRTFYLALAATWIELAWLVAANGGNRGGTIGFGTKVTWPAYVLTQFQALVSYLRLSFWPHPLVFDYGPFWVHGAAAILPYAIPVIVLGTLALAALKRGSAWGFLGGWFFGILAVTSLAPGTTQMIVEHRMYLPLAAVLTAALVGLEAACRRWLPRPGPVFLAVSLALAAAAGALTFHRNRVYQSAVAVWADTVAKRPANAEAHNNLAVVLGQSGQVAESIAEYHRALALLPDFTEAHFNLGLVLYLTRREDAGIAEFEQALHFKEDYAMAHHNLGLALQRQGRVAEALAHAERAVALDPGYAEGHAALATDLGLLGRLPEAIDQYGQALRLDPDSAKDHYNLGLLLLNAGRSGEAAQQFGGALRLDPAHAEAAYNLGMILAGSGRMADAAPLFARAVQAKPAYAEAQLALGNIAMVQGHPDEAITHYRHAAEANPALPDAFYNLGNGLVQVGRFAEAAANYERALELRPDFAQARQNLQLVRSRLGVTPVSP